MNTQEHQVLLTNLEQIMPKELFTYSAANGPVNVHRRPLGLFHLQLYLTIHGMPLIHAVFYSRILAQAGDKLDGTIRIPTMAREAGMSRTGVYRRIADLESWGFFARTTTGIGMPPQYYFFQVDGKSRQFSLMAEDLRLRAEEPAQTYIEPVL